MAGYRTVLGSLRARLVVGLMIAQKFVRGCLNVLIVVTAFRVLDAGPGAVGYMTAAIGIGGLIGALGALTLVGRQLATTFGVALVVWGLPIVLVAPRPYLVLALVLLALVGVANSVEDVAAFTLLQRVVPDALLTRVLGVVWGLAMGALALGSITAPALVRAIGPRPALVAVGAILPRAHAHRVAWPYRDRPDRRNACEGTRGDRVRAHVRPSPDRGEGVPGRDTRLGLGLRPVKSSFARARSETASTSWTMANWRWWGQACRQPPAQETTSARSP